MISEYYSTKYKTLAQHDRIPIILYSLLLLVCSMQNNRLVYTIYPWCSVQFTLVLLNSELYSRHCLGVPPPLGKLLKGCVYTILSSLMAWVLVVKYSISIHLPQVHTQLYSIKQMKYMKKLCFLLIYLSTIFPHFLSFSITLLSDV